MTGKSRRGTGTYPRGGDLLTLAGTVLVLAGAATVGGAAYLAGASSLPPPGGYLDLFVQFLCLVAAGGALISLGRDRKEGREARDVLAATLGAAGDGARAGETGIRAAAEAASRRLARLGEELSSARAEVERLREQEPLELKALHADLLTHHRITKKMLRASDVSEVYENLLRGLRDGLGFRGALLGYKDAEGHLVFYPAGTDGGTGEPIRIPLWHERSILARTMWRGDRCFVNGVDAAGGAAEDRLVLGEGSAFLVPIAANPGSPTAEPKAYWKGECPACYGVFDHGRCWMARASGPAEPSVETKMECARCRLFPSAAILAVREQPDGRPLAPETTGPIVTLANEASLALELVTLHEDARRMSVTDGLTGLLNHREFYNCARRELERARRYRRTLSLLMIDLDDFKRVNDRYGHLAGDAVLRKVADLLRGCARATDIIARYGGEEFGVIMPESTPSGALMLAERIKTEIADHDFLPHEPGGVRLTASVGIYSTEGGAVTEDELVRCADEAAYRAKTGGKNRVVVKTDA